MKYVRVWKSFVNFKSVSNQSNFQLFQPHLFSNGLQYSYTVALNINKFAFLKRKIHLDLQWYLCKFNLIQLLKCFVGTMVTWKIILCGPHGKCQKCLPLICVLNSKILRKLVNLGTHEILIFFISKQLLNDLWKTILGVFSLA